MLTPCHQPSIKELNTKVISQIMHSNKQEVASKAFAQFGTKRFEDLEDVSVDLQRLSEPGYWVVVASFENSFLLLKFKNLRENHEPLQGVWAGVENSNWQSSMDKNQYVQAVQKLKDHIELGDVYQTNICRVLKNNISRDEFDIEGLAVLLERENPAPYSSVIKVGKEANFRLNKDVLIASASPELFLKIENGFIYSAPIKGTGKTQEDLTEKDKAENIMIVDLVRNDLSIICKTGSVEVPKLLEIQQHPGLVHLVSTVRGELKENVSWAEIFAATFPPGSVSGAPKISALKLINKLENSIRGPYCGAIGWIDSFKNQAQLSVGIRTFWIDNDELLFGTGAGITWGSDPEHEWKETELKCERLFAIASKKNV